jgi:hypothetical protein
MAFMFARNGVGEKPITARLPDIVLVVTPTKVLIIHCMTHCSGNHTHEGRFSYYRVAGFTARDVQNQLATAGRPY